MKFKRILLTSLVCLLAGGLMGGYFYHVGKLSRERRRAAVCSGVDIHILDSAESSIINRNDVMDMINTPVLGEKTDSINLPLVERMVLANGEILSSQAYMSAEGRLNVEVTQRRPVARFENSTERYYSDSSGYLFPVSRPVKLPIITGNIPLRRGSDFKGYGSKEETAWITSMTSLVGLWDSDRYWRQHIQQINIENNGDIALYLDSGPEKIIFGPADGAAAKMKKLKSYYETIAPEHAPKVYSVVNLKYKNQIICK